MRQWLLRLFPLLMSIFPVLTRAQVEVRSAAPSAGDVASNLTVASGFFAGMLGSIFYIVGIALVTASIMQYREYKRNPSQTPISRPIILFVCGLVLGLMPVAAQYLNNIFVPYSV
jgi:amino acid transporter